MYQRLGRWSFRNRRLVVVLWALALVGANAAGAAAGAAFNGEFEIPASESADGFEVLSENFPGAGGSFGGSIVFEAEQGVDDPEIQAAMTALFDEIAELEVDTSLNDEGIDADDVAVTSPYSEFGARQVSADRTIAFASVNLSLHIDQTESAKIGEEIKEHAPDIEGLRVEIGGAALSEFEPPETELIGLAFAIVVLILAFGSVLAMGLPIGVALAGVATGGLGIVTLLTNVVSVPDFAPILGVMIGLGVGIDYALFIVTRYRELTRQGLDPEEATVGAMDTAGRAVVFAGITVVVSLLGMLLIGLAFISGLGIAAATTVAVTMFASITLLPALLGFAQHRVEVTRWRGLVAAAFAALALLSVGLGYPPAALVFVILAVATIIVSFLLPALRREVPQRTVKPLRDTIAYRWSRLIQRQPWLWLTLGGGLLLLLSAPLLGIRLGFSDEGNFSEETTTRQAYDMIAEGFGPGFNGPFLVTVELDSAAAAQGLGALVAALEADPGVAGVGQPFPNDIENPQAATAYLLQVIPTSSPQDEATVDTVNRLRESVIPPVIDGNGLDVSVTGAVPANIDFTSYLSGRLFLFLGVVLALSFVLLMAVFRSLLVPVKAVIMNMLSISAAYGVVVALFQWGWFSSVTGIEPAPIEPFIPMMMFAIVFGLSMDYEVFLLSRVKEEYDRTGDAANSVADGLAATATVITAAAAIMVVVFGSFLLEDDRIIKLFGVGLATAVLLDATLVRMLLVPATMELLGEKNWWIPKWLDKILPTINVEGPAEMHGDLAVGAVVPDAEASPSAVS